MASNKTIDNPDFKFVKNSLKNVAEKDQKFCENLVDYIDMSSLTGDDEFFYDMMIAIRFMNEPGHVAFTTPDKLIYLNPPR